MKNKILFLGRIRCVICMHLMKFVLSFTFKADTKYATYYWNLSSAKAERIDSLLCSGEYLMLSYFLRPTRACIWIQTAWGKRYWQCGLSKFRISCRAFCISACSGFWKWFESHVQECWVLKLRVPEFGLACLLLLRACVGSFLLYKANEISVT